MDNCPKKFYFVPMKIKKRKANSPPLSEETKKIILTHYLNGTSSVRTLAENYGVSKSSIHRIVRGFKKKKVKTIKSKGEVENGGKAKVQPPPLVQPKEDQGPSFEVKRSPVISQSPIEFKTEKLEEIGEDIVIARLRGSIAALPQLHKLSLSVHDEIQILKENQGEEISSMSTEGIISKMVSTISRLPPLLRHSIMDQLEEIQRGRIISFPNALESDLKEGEEEIG